MSAKTIIGLLNTTLKGIRIATKTKVTEESATHIMKGILISIKDKDDRASFIDYCLQNYTIQL